MLSNSPARPLEHFRDYLCLLARMQLDPRMQKLLDSSDFAQETLLKAYQKQEQFRGQTESQRAAWLRAILANTMADALRKFARQQGSQQQSLEDALAASAGRLEAWLVDAAPSPRQQAEWNEQVLRLSHALARLPEDQRTALELRHLQGQGVPAISELMQRSTAAVAGLLRRGLKTLREIMNELPDEK